MPIFLDYPLPLNQNLKDFIEAKFFHQVRKWWGFWNWGHPVPEITKQEVTKKNLKLSFNADKSIGKNLSSEESSLVFSRFCWEFNQFRENIDFPMKTEYTLEPPLPRNFYKSSKKTYTLEDSNGNSIVVKIIGHDCTISEAVSVGGEVTTTHGPCQIIVRKVPQRGGRKSRRNRKSKTRRNRRKSNRRRKSKKSRKGKVRKNRRKTNRRRH